MNMATQKQEKNRGQGQAITVQRGQDREVSRDRIPTAQPIARTRPFSMMRRMLDDLDDLGSFALTSPFGVTSPFATMRRMFDNMERMFEGDFVSDVDLLPERNIEWSPRIEITQRDDKLVVRTDLPGVPEDQIQISADGDSLVIEGERPMPSEQQEDVWCSECAHGRFRRVVALPDGRSLIGVELLRDQ
jgi:HSP20 family protein